MIFETNKEKKVMSLKNPISSKKLHFVKFDKSACVNCNEWLQKYDVMVLDYDVIPYGRENTNYKIILAYTESDKKNL